MTAPRPGSTHRTPDADDLRGEPGPAIVVSGGAGGIDARFDDIELLGDLYAQTAGRLLQWAWDDKLEAADGDLLASAVLAPRTFAEAEEAVLAATAGPRGLAVRAAVLEAQSLCFSAVVRIYRGADDAQHAAMEALAYCLGFAVGRQLPEVLVVGGLLHAGLELVDPELARRAERGLVDLLEHHPELLETLVNGGGGLLDGLGSDPLAGPVMHALGVGGFHPDTASAADDLGALLFGDYEGELAEDYPLDVFDHEPPRDVEDLMEDLGVVAGGDVPDGVITVQRLETAEGHAGYVVQLPGTDDFFSDDAARNMGSNLNLIAGDDTAYGDAVDLALAAVGVEADAPVMLVGHSQGGMQAAALAADPDFGYDVTHVVTAGAPVATTDVPDEVTVLSLENTGDVVPLLDGEPNQPAAHHATVQADVHTGDLGAADGANHSMSTYESIASSVDDSRDPSLRHVVAGMHDRGFLAADGEAVQSTTFSFQVRTGEQVRPAELGGLGSLVGVDPPV